MTSNNKALDIGCLGVVLAIFWYGITRDIQLPGLYMDAVNPDYLAAIALSGNYDNPAASMPTRFIPMLGNLYHGVQNLYVSLAVFTVFGISIPSVRIAQALFGAGIVVFVYVLTVQITRNRLAGFIGAALLACELAFTASFRTQFYIILGGEMWLLASLVALHTQHARRFFLSGLFFGLAIYGYFVLGFFAPAMAILIWIRPDRDVKQWLKGFAWGMSPYVLGYLLLMLKVGGVRKTAQFIMNATQGLDPLSSKLSLLDSVEYALRGAYLAVSDIGNELMIFNHGEPSVWVKMKVVLFVGVVAVALIRAYRKRALLIALLPLSYLAVAVFFGNRLWAHHFVVLVPLAYLLLALVLGDLLKGKIATIAAILLGTGFASANAQQSNVFHAELLRTGGTGKTTSALTVFASDALKEAQTIYVFPDWGFFMSFCLLTENKVPYVLEFDKLESRRGKNRSVILPYWSKEDTQKYKDMLASKGITSIRETSYVRKDGEPAFWVLKGDFPH